MYWHAFIHSIFLLYYQIWYKTSAEWFQNKHLRVEIKPHYLPYVNNRISKTKVSRTGNSHGSLPRFDGLSIVQLRWCSPWTNFFKLALVFGSHMLSQPVTQVIRRVVYTVSRTRRRRKNTCRRPEKIPSSSS